MLEVVKSLADRERDKYLSVWADDRYRQYSPGEKWFNHALEALKPEKGETLIDYGCGTGRATKKFETLGLSVTGIDHVSNALEADIDFIEACLWDLPACVSDLAYCTDVMEHIPFEKVDDVLDTIARNTKRCAFFAIHTGKDGFGPAVLGEPLHLTIRPDEWWRDKLAEHFGAARTIRPTCHVTG